MKKSFFIIAAVVIVAATAITVSSCKKDKTEESNTNETVAKNYELSDMDKAMIAFGEKMKAASDERSGETMPLAEALNTLSNYQNYTMCDASHYSTEMVTDTFKVTLNVCNGQVLLSELNRIYETTKPEILEKLNSLDGDEKAIYIIKTFVKETPRNGLDGYTGTLDARVVTRMMDSFGTPNMIKTAFDSTDYWYDFDSLGKCGQYVGQCVGRDCVTELKTIISNRLTTIACGSGYYTVFFDQEDIEIEAIDYPDVHSPNSHYALPWRSFWDDPQCVSPDEMNYYLNKLLQILNNMEITYSKIIVDIYFSEKETYRELNHNTEFYAIITMADYGCFVDTPEE